MTRGGADLPPPSKMGCNGWEVQKLSWNLISYQDWCQTWGFTTFRNLEPPELMVWKSDFFRPSMRFVRVPPYESWANWTNFCSSWENGDFLEGQKCCILFHTQNEEKSKKISTCIRIHSHVCAKTWWWGQICPPSPESNRVKTSAWTSCNPLRVFFAVPIAFGPPEQYFFMIFVDTRWQNISLWFCPWLFPLWFYPRRAIMETLYLHVNYMCLIYKWQIPFVAMKLLFVSCI